MFGFLKKGLAKTLGVVKESAPKKREYIEKEALEDILIEADVEYELVEKLLETLPDSVNRFTLKTDLALLFSDYEAPKMDEKPFVDIIVGVNGAGKTTTIAKLANNYKQEGKRVMLGAGDTFRAAAIEQLVRWADRIDVPIVYSRQGHDPSAVAYDVIESAKAKGFEHVLIDTAGRLHNQTNLGNELKKIVRVSQKAMSSAPHRKLLVLDGTQGNSAIAQAKAFNALVGIDGIIITKLDGTAKGGSIFSISNELKIPILYVGVGEGMEDLTPFNANEFIDTILDEIFI